MSTLTERLKEVMASRGWSTDQQVADIAGVSRSAVAQWLGKGSKMIHTIGNMEAAENLERETGYAALWIAKGVGPKRSSMGKPPEPEWPLRSVNQDKLRSLSSTHLAQIEGAILLTAAQLGVDIKKDEK